MGVLQCCQFADGWTNVRGVWDHFLDCSAHRIESQPGGVLNLCVAHGLHDLAGETRASIPWSAVQFPMAGPVDSYRQATADNVDPRRLHLKSFDPRIPFLEILAKQELGWP